MKTSYASLNSRLFMVLYDIITDLEFTPRIQIDVNAGNNRRPLIAPDRYANDGVLTLDIGPNQIENWYIEHAEGVMTFSATFGGTDAAVIIPVEYIIAIYARENPKLGNLLDRNLTFFTTETIHTDVESTDDFRLTRVVPHSRPIPDNVSTFKKPHLTIVK